MNIRILATGRIKEKSLAQMCEEYLKRLSGYCPVSVIELTELAAPAGLDKSAQNKIKEKEALYLEEKIRKDEYLIALDKSGKTLSSEEFAAELSSLFSSGKNGITFLIGGSLGLSENLKKKADSVISFSKLTFPHQLFRVIFLEQLYRAFKILRREPYHK